MRLYLSSFRLGAHPHRIVDLVREGRRAAVIANAIDNEPADVRVEKVEAEIGWLTDLGLATEELDLRDFFDPGRQSALAETLESYQLLWLRGGNVFLLRHALKASRADDLIVDALRRDAFVYAGYSAGPCVLSPDLLGLAVVDDITAVEQMYGVPATTTGLGVLDFAFVPHVRSPEHPDSAACENVADAYRAGGLPYRARSDGQVLIIDGQTSAII